MSHLRHFVAGAGTVASIQEHILDALHFAFPEKEYAQIEAVILAPGYTGWESRAIHCIKAHVEESFNGMEGHCAGLSKRFEKAIPYPNQSTEFWVDTTDKPHLRSFWCTRCGFKQTAMSLAGICCYGMPACTRCNFELHEPTCKRKDANGRIPKK